MLQSIQHSWSSLSEFVDIVVQSDEVTSILLRGRESLQSLNENEQMRFTLVHVRLLNAIECWLMMIIESYPQGSLRKQHLKNIDGLIVEFFNHPGSLDLLKSMNPAFFMPELQELFEKNTGYVIGECRNQNSLSQ